MGVVHQEWVEGEVAAHQGQPKEVWALCPLLGQSQQAELALLTLSFPTVGAHHPGGGDLRGDLLVPTGQQGEGQESTHKQLSKCRGLK